MTTITDSFNRANGALGNADTGETWTQVGPANFTIVSNHASISSTEGVAIADATFSHDVDITIELTANPSNSGIVLHYRDLNNLTYVQVNAAVVGLYRRAAGTFATLASTGNLRASGESLRVVSIDGVVYCYADTQLVIAHEDDFSLVTDTGVGIRGISSTINSFTATDIVSPIPDLTGEVIDDFDLPGDPLESEAWVYKGRDAKALDTVGAS